MIRIVIQKQLKEDPIVKCFNEKDEELSIDVDMITVTKNKTEFVLKGWFLQK